MTLDDDVLLEKIEDGCGEVSQCKSKLSIDASDLLARDTREMTREEKQRHVGVIDLYIGSA